MGLLSCMKVGSSSDGTGNEYSFQFSVCHWAWIFCLTLNIKTNANKSDSLGS